MKRRFEELCQTCACYYTNWEPQVQDLMDEQAPGEDCSQGQHTWEFGECPGWSELADED